MGAGEIAGDPGRRAALAFRHASVAADRELARLDEKLFLEVFAQTPKAKPPAAARKR